MLAVAVRLFLQRMLRRGPPRGRWPRGGRRRPGSAPHDVETAHPRGLLELVGQVVQQARGRHDRLSRQPRDQPVDHHVGEPFDLGVDGWDRLVRQHSWRPAEVGHARINSSMTLDAGRCVTVERQVTTRPEKVRATVACAYHKSTRQHECAGSFRMLVPPLMRTGTGRPQ